MANSRRLTEKLRHSSPDCAARLRLAAIAEGCEMKNGLTQPSRTTDSHTSRMATNDTVPRSTGADFQPAIPFIFQPSTILLPALARQTSPQVRTEKPAARQRAGNRFGI